MAEREIAGWEINFPQIVAPGGTQTTTGIFSGNLTAGVLLSRAWIAIALAANAPSSVETGTGTVTVKDGSTTLVTFAIPAGGGYQRIDIPEATLISLNLQQATAWVDVTATLFMSGMNTVGPETIGGAGDVHLLTGGATLKQYAFTVQPPRNFSAGTSSATQISALNTSSQTVASGATSTLSITLVKSSSLAEVSTGLKNSSGTAVTSISATMTSGLADYVYSIPTSTTAGVYKLRGDCTSSCVGASPIYSQEITNSAAGLSWTTQPSSSVGVGKIIGGSPAVSALNSTGGTNTAYTADITVTPVLLDGATQALGTLLGTTTVAPTNGVSTYTTLRYTKTGRIALKAASGSLIAISTPIDITGQDDPADFAGLRQNKRDDSTKRVLTDGRPSSATASSQVSFTQESILDGDLAVTAGVTTDGVRYVHPNTISLKRVRMKGILSNLNLNPTVELWGSTDTTTGTDGTWTLQTSFVPTNVNVMKTLEFAQPVYLKGVWLSIDDNGGTSTMNWQAIHIIGPYLGPLISLMDLGTLDTVKDEETLSIPKPAQKIGSGGATVVRAVNIRNNASNATIIITHEAARYKGDSLMGTAFVSVLDQAGVAIDRVTLASNAAQTIQLKYVITSSQNDASGKHYERFSLLAVQAGNIFSNVQANGANLTSTQIEVNSSLTLVRSYLNPGNVSGGVQGICIDTQRSELFAIVSSAANSTGTHTIAVWTIGTSTSVRTLALSANGTANGFNYIAATKGTLALTNGSGALASRKLLIDAVDGSLITSMSFTTGSGVDNLVISDQEHGRFFFLNSGSASSPIKATGTTGNVLWTGTDSNLVNYGMSYDYVNNEVVLIRASATNNIVFVKRLSADTGLEAANYNITSITQTFSAVPVNAISHHPDQGEYWFINANTGTFDHVFLRNPKTTSGAGTYLGSTSSFVDNTQRHGVAY